MKLGFSLPVAGLWAATLQIISRGTYRVFDSPQGADRRPLFGTLDEIRRDIGRYADAGLTELFLEANFTPPAASPDVDPTSALDATLTTMEALAPSPG